MSFVGFFNGRFVGLLVGCLDDLRVKPFGVGRLDGV